MTDIEILKKYYGFTTKDAKFYKKQITYKTMELIRKSFESNAKKTFYED